MSNTSLDCKEISDKKQGNGIQRKATALCHLEAKRQEKATV